MSSDRPEVPSRFTRRGFLVVVSGPSGVGKTSFCTHLLETRRDAIRSVSATTRAPRPGEVDGRDYFYLDPAAFTAKAAAGEFLEHAEVHGHRYGTPRRFVDEQVAAGRIVLLNIDVQGGLQVKDRYDDAVAIFVWPPSLDALRARLLARAQDDPAEVARRLADAPGELAQHGRYDYLVVNEDLPAALLRVSAIVEAERARVSRLVPAATLLHTEER
jgi:guanylate kinase